MSLTVEETTLYYLFISEKVDVIVKHLLDGTHTQSKVALLALHDRGYVGERVSKEKDEELATLIREYYQKKERRNNLKMVVGDIYLSDTNEPYVLSVVDYDDEEEKEICCLINVYNGNRYANPMSIDELKESMVEDPLFKFTHRPDLKIVIQ